MSLSKIIYFLFAAAVLNGATDGHAATRPAPAERGVETPATPAGNERPIELRGALEASTLPPLPSAAELRLKH